MRYIELSGSSKDIGWQHGKAFAADIQRCYEYYCLRTGKTPDRLDISIRNYFEKHFPVLAEEIDGIAQGASMSYEQLLVYNHFNMISGCTAFYFRETDLGPILSQNLDCDPFEQQSQVIRVVHPNQGQAFLSVSMVGTVWGGNFINESGLCLSSVSAHQAPYRAKDGTSGRIIESYIARYGETVDDAFEIINRYNYIGKVSVSLFADRNKNAVLIEGNPEKKFATPIEEPFGHSTGLFITGNVKPKDEPEYLRIKEARNEVIRQLYMERAFDMSLDGMKKLMSYHTDDIGSICRHEKNGGSCTQSARIIIQEQKALLICDGPPCCSKFEKYVL